MAKSSNKYRNPERDAYYEDLEKQLKSGKEEKDALVVKSVGFVIDDNEPKDEPTPEPDEGNWKKRYGDLQRHLAAKQREWDSEKQELTSKIERLESQTKAPELPTNLNDEKIAEWEKKFPDVAAIIDYKAQKRAKEIASGLEEKVTVLEQGKAQIDRQRAYLQLLQHHEDYEDIRTSEEFRDWLAEQDEDFVKAITNPSSYDEKSVLKAARVVDFFKLETGWGKDKKTPEKKKDNSAAEAIPSRSSNPEEFDEHPRYTESQIAKMTSKEFEQHKDKILAAQRKGEPYFVHDLTGAAR